MNLRYIPALLLTAVMLLSLSPASLAAEPGLPAEDTAAEAPDIPEAGDTAQKPVPAEVDFSLEPAELSLEVYTLSGGEKTVIEPEESGIYLLLPGTYFYSASCEGYESIADREFTVKAGSEAVAAEVRLSEAPAPEEETEDVPPAETGESKRITDQINAVYNAALGRSGRESFYEYCADYVNWQLVVLGINYSYAGANGNGEFDAYRDRTQTSGGYYINAYPASEYSLSSALDEITRNGTKNAYNILVGFEQSPGENGKLYGHTCFIHAIENGTVYFSESFNMDSELGSYPEGSPIVCSQDRFCSYYDTWTVLDGVIHFDREQYIRLSEENFPDAHFREYLSTGFDADGDGFLSTSERDGITDISVSGFNFKTFEDDPDRVKISSLRGIEYFPKLKSLNCVSNRLEELDLSGNPDLERVFCWGNQLRALDVSGSPALKILYCWNNKLTGLDVSGSPGLTDLDCGGNCLAGLDLSANRALQELGCDSNSLVIPPEGISTRKLPGFDAGRVISCTGGSFSPDGMFTFDTGSGEASYEYDAGNGRTAVFTLKKADAPVTPGGADGAAQPE